MIRIIKDLEILYWRVMTRPSSAVRESFDLSMMKLATLQTSFDSALFVGILYSKVRMTVGTVPQESVFTSHGHEHHLKWLNFFSHLGLEICPASSIPCLLLESSTRKSQGRGLPCTQVVELP